MNNHYKTLREIEDLINRFLDQSLPKEEWTHEAHLTVATYLLNKFSIEETTCMLRSGIIIYNKSVGGENTAVKGYHETLTLFWIKNICIYIKANKAKSILLLCNNFLKSIFADRDYPLKFYSKELLFSTKARAFWTEPDKENFPG